MTNKLPDETDFKRSEIEKNLNELRKESSPQKIRSILSKLMFFSSENKDIAREILESGSVEVLVELYNSTKGKSVRGQISCIFLLLSFEANGNDDNSISNVTITALSNIFSKSDLNVFLQSMIGIKDIATLSLTASSSASQSPPTHFLSVASCVVILEKTTELLSSPTLKERAKLDVLDILLQLVGAGVMNEAVEFVAWRQSQKDPPTPSEGKVVESVEMSARFIKAFEAFSSVIKDISLVQKMGAFYSTGKQIYHSILEKSFFPTFVQLGFAGKLPMQFVTDSSNKNCVTIVGTKITWNNTGEFWGIMDEEIKEGIYSLVVEGNGNLGYFGIGLAAKSRLGDHHGCYLMQKPDTCCVQHDGIFIGTKNCYSNSFYSSGKITLALEYNGDAHTAYFFVNGAQIQHSVANVPASVYATFCGTCQGLTAEVKSFERLSTPTISKGLQCATYSWG